MSVFKHGDDFVVSGTRKQQREFEEKLYKNLIVKHLAKLVSCTALGDVTEVRILNRIVRWVRPHMNQDANVFSTKLTHDTQS